MHDVCQVPRLPPHTPLVRLKARHRQRLRAVLLPFGAQQAAQALDLLLRHPRLAKVHLAHVRQIPVLPQA